MADDSVMGKYDLSPNELEAIKRRWREGGYITEVNSTATQLVKERRTHHRFQPLFEIEIRDSQNPLFVGIVNDIHHKGLQVIGLKAEINKERQLVITAAPHKVYEDIPFHAQCRWAMVNDCGFCVAGFRIIEISPHASRELQKLLDNLKCV